ncbi:hypothetical protein GQ55_2G359700 [Panicum hallii var. hallii]|uniref:Mannose-P-dolichol utilization defect 1 protein homolog n=2 Tax=Panicum hallii TaxID=206008 RepID=A0A2T7EW26_9POAL|nr:hypothetical protein PAHAL_2G371400 [Panicum hallii]PUZ72018.1 hypothetical protein GQ55_2G359700 [Panicum hallii var. hallii]
MISAVPVLCSGITVGTLQAQSVHQITSSKSPTLTSFKLSREPSSLNVCSPRKPAIRIQSLPGPQNLEASEMSKGKRLASGMQLDTMGMNMWCFLSFPLDANILLPFLSKVLGYSIIAASTVAKLPQILKILKHGSVRGLSVASFELEVVGYTIALAYCIHKGLPFSAYGELAFLLIQAIILVAIIYYYSPPMGSKTWMKALLYCGLAPTVLAGKIDPGLFEVLYASQHAIFFFARVPQIWKNFTNKGTGELSFLTCFMNFAGSIVRVFTSIQEKTPLSVIMGSAIGIVMNGTLLGQILLYQKPTPKKQKKED